MSKPKKRSGYDLTTNHKYERFGECPICKKSTTLYSHHILKQVVFGRNDEIVYICTHCHEEIDRSVRMFEQEILKRFEPIYRTVYRNFVRNGYISHSHVERLTKNRFARIKAESFIKKKEHTVSSRQSKKRRRSCANLTREQFLLVKNGSCPICGTPGPLTVHHVRKKMVFGENNEIVFPCQSCHVRIEQAITAFESIVLGQFICSYRWIWDNYKENGSVKNTAIKRLAKRDFLDAKARMLRIDKTKEKIIQKRLIATDANTIVKNLEGTKIALYNGS